MTAPTVVRQRLPILGMDCADCARTLERALGETDGVVSAEVRFELGTAVVAYDDTQVTPARLTRVVEQAGYRVAQPPSPDSASCHLTFDVQGMDCADCARSAQMAVSRLNGVKEADVQFETGILRLEATDATLDPGLIIRAIESAGYKAVLREGPRVASVRTGLWSDRRVHELAGAAGLWILGMVAEHGLDLRGVAIGFYLAAIVLAGFRIARAARVSLSVRRADMNLLMTLAAIGAVILGDFSEASSLVVLFSIGIWLQSATLDRTRGAIASLLDMAPTTARLIRGEQDLSIPAAEVHVGDVVRVLPGERIPVDGHVSDGRSDVNQAQITGESNLRSVSVGDEVFAGSMTITGALQVTASSPGTDTSLTRIVDLVEQAQSSKAAIQGTVDRFAAIYTPAVIALAASVGLLGGLISGEWGTWVYRGLILLVVACPCALVISTPVAFVASIGRASRMGVLFKGGSALDALASIKILAFDKTGTLTHGRPEVVAVVAHDASEADVLELAAGLEQGSTHPIARGVLLAASAWSVQDVREIAVVAGLGVTGLVDGMPVAIGTESLFATVPSELHGAKAAAENDGKTAVMVGRSGTAIGLIVLADSVRPISPSVVAELKALHIEPMMLSGDNTAVVAGLAKSVGIERFEAGLLPQDKARIIQELSASSAIGMVGDGINDAPALAQATVGIAMGVGGSAAAIDAADVALMGDDLTKLPIAVRLARATQAIVRQNIAFALVTKLGFVALTVGGFTSLWLAVAADVGASLLVTLNAMRLSRASD